MKEMLYEAQEQAPSPEGKTSIEYSIILKVYKDVNCCVGFDCSALKNILTSNHMTYIILKIFFIIHKPRLR